MGASEEVMLKIERWSKCEENIGRAGTSDFDANHFNIGEGLCTKSHGTDTLGTDSCDVCIAIEIPCAAYVSQSGTPRVEWKFEKGSSIVLFYYDSKFTDPYKGRAQYTPTGIRFTSVTRKDTGKYICEVLWTRSGGNGQLRKSEVDLIVQENIISYKDMKALVTSGNARIIDVRLPGEVANGRIANSVNVPVAEVEEALKMDPETFKMKYGMDKPRMDDENLIFYCQRGKRAARATEIAMTLGYAKARNYAGSYEEWSEKEGK
ncbi:Thiosulfate sulfurtransferase/rhodanese-like domain-containing protein 1 [Chelonia mydas]|uniref:Thiosulfate sulfurtransferase/rhodanese-like domain-containing protein 1 n=1 Tax=Chelonia mydas TaxID=8469 RepID=M7BSH0_CHEMY|nr:Thiosulfate sulfurtransferase/rhodanese-like domain-containing protein 1 [Chelonia mydas]